MTEGTILRVYGFRPLGSGAELDAALRDEILPEMLELPGILDAYLGRQGDGAVAERVIASVWESREAMAAGLGESSAIGRFQPERVEDLTSSRLDILPVGFAVRMQRAEPPVILRVYRGVVHEGQLDVYMEEARTGTLADADSNPGLVALYLGAMPPASFITVSAWTSWSAIETATGGDIRHPMVTRNAVRIGSGGAAHYEILPSSNGPPAHPPAG